jgi:myo-inositol-1(or 4)-monophosphatase
MAAGALLIQEAGGLVGDLAGEPDFMQSGDVCAATPKLFPTLLESLR